MSEIEPEIVEETSVDEDKAPITAPPKPPWASTAISIAVHAAIVLLLILGLPLFDRKLPDIKGEHPISVSLIEAPPERSAPPAPVPAPAPSPAVSVPAPTPPRQVAPAPAQPQQQPVQPQQEAALPFDPSFNPFATAQPSEMRESEADINAPSTSGEAQSVASPPAPAPAMDGGDGVDQTGDFSPSGPTGPGGPQAGDPKGDPSHKPQYLRIQLHGYVNAVYAPELHNFLQRLINCGVVPIPATNPNLSVEADVDFAPTGFIIGSGLTNQAIYGTDPAYQLAASKLLAALGKPSCAYIRLPPNYYPIWRQVHLSFFQRVPGQ